MKNTIFLGIASLFISAAASAQTDSSKVQPTTPPVASATPANWAKADDYLPAHLKGATSTTLEPKHYLPVLGSYQPTGESTANLTVTVDEQNIGIIWIDGLPQGRVKALLRKSPAIYKIPAQKTAEGKSVPEGTLIYDKDANTLSVALGTALNDADPAAPFTSATTSTKSKTKVWKYTGAKADAAAVQTPAPAEQQQQQQQ